MTTKRRSRRRTRRPAVDTLIFVGPTLAASEIDVAGAQIRPPAAVGDILAASKLRGLRRIVLIDGYFERMAAVWHKEILIALERGIDVWGAASMGALRAAELRRFGMRGFGTIYQAFVNGSVGASRKPRGLLGALVADDEVAVAHLPAAQGYRAVSDALVNLRDGLARAARARVITAPTRDALIALACARFYRERSWARLVEDGREAGLPERELAALAAWPKPDRKADDARALLAALATSRGSRPRRPRVPRTWALRQLERL